MPLEEGPESGITSPRKRDNKDADEEAERRTRLSNTAYEVLGVSPFADQAEINRAWKSLQMAWHPNRSEHPKATEVTQSINSSYDVLKEPVRRRVYDITVGLNTEFGDGTAGLPGGLGQKLMGEGAYGQILRLVERAKVRRLKGALSHDDIRYQQYNPHLSMVPVLLSNPAAALLPTPPGECVRRPTRNQVPYELKLPDIVVIGVESSGKSSLMERLAIRAVFPRGENVTTRMPVRMKMRHVRHENVVILRCMRGSQQQAMQNYHRGDLPHVKYPLYFLAAL
eukprot:1186681-Prorocentrum_minimum.AAC.1